MQIRVYANRLAIWNPCSLPEGWTLKKLLGPHSSAPHNPAIAHVFFRSGEIETWGRGIQRILTACSEAETPKPRVTLEPTGLWTEFPFAPSYLQTIDATDPKQSSTGRHEVTAQVGTLLRVVSGENSREEIQEAPAKIPPHRKRPRLARQTPTLNTYQPDYLKFCHQIGLNYVSCSPFSVPVARLAAAQAALEETK